MMEKPATSPRDKLVAKLVLLALPGAFACWTALSMYGRLRQICAQPDLNGDGRFSILDVPGAFISILLEVGNRYQAVLANTKIGPFLEMSSDHPNIFWSVALAAFTYFIILSGMVLVSKVDD